MNQWIRVGDVAQLRAPVFIHWSVLPVVAALGLFSLRSPIYAVLAIGCYLAVIAIHEIGHALVARHLGYNVTAIRIALLHGQCVHEAPETEWEEVLIAWGGVLAQLLIAAPVLILAELGGLELPYVGLAVVFLGYLNVFVALINLAPTPGLDGATAWRIIPLGLRQWRASRATRRALRAIARRK